MSAQIKLAIRTEKENNIIRAFVTDESEKPIVEISHFSLRVADVNEKAFDVWIEAMKAITKLVIEDAFDVPVVGFETFGLEDKN